MRSTVRDRCAVLAMGAFLTLLSQACTNNDGEAPEDLLELSKVISTIHDATYVGVGSFWEWDLDADGTFHVEYRETLGGAADLSADGTYQNYPSGFYLFTVTQASGSDAPSVGQQAYGFAVPEVVLIVKPIGAGDTEELVMPATGTCPSEPLDAIWLEAKTMDNEGDLFDETFWGRATVPLSGPLTGKSFNLAGTVSPPSGEATFTTVTGCSEGVIHLDNGAGDVGFIHMTPSGVSLVTTDVSDSRNSIIGMPRDPSVSATSLAGKNFVGLLFMEDDGVGNVQPLRAELDAAGEGSYTFIGNVETNASGDSGGLEVAEVGTGDKAGFLKLEAHPEDGDGSTPTMWAAVVPDLAGLGITFFFATGMDVPSGGGMADDSFAVVMVEK